MEIESEDRPELRDAGTAQALRSNSEAIFRLETLGKSLVSAGIRLYVAS